MKKYGSSQSKSPRSIVGKSTSKDMSRNSVITKSQMITKKPQSIFSTAKKSQCSQNLIIGISKGLSSLTANENQQTTTIQSGLGLGQANRRITAHKQSSDLKIIQKFQTETKEQKKSHIMINSSYSTVKPFDTYSQRSSAMNSAQKKLKNHSPKSAQYSALSKGSRESKKSFQYEQKISLYARCRQTNIPVNLKTSVVERR